MSTTRTRRQFSKELKLQVLREIEAGKSVAQAAREHQVHPNCIANWRTQQAKYGRLQPVPLRSIVCGLYTCCCLSLIFS